MKKDKRKFSLIDKIFGVLAFISVFIFILHYFVLPVKAAGPNSLPYVISKHQSLYSIQENSWYSDMITKTVNKIGSHSWTNFIDYDTILFRVTDINTNTSTVYIYWVFNPYTESMIEANYNAFDVTVSTLQIKFTDSYVFHTTYNYSTGAIGGMYRESASFYVFGTPNTITSSVGTYTPNYPMLLYGSDDAVVLSSSNQEMISQNTSIIPLPDPGIAVPIIFNQDDELTDDGTVDFPTMPNLPSFPTIVLDTTNIESILTSIYDYFSAFKDYVGELFSTFFGWLVDVIKNVGQSIRNAIKEFGENFYENMYALLQPILERIDYIVQPISATVIYDNISSTTFVSNITTIETSLTSFSNSFQNLSEPNSFTIPIHLENLPSSMFGNLNTQYIDLSVIDPVKTILRTFMWALTTYGLFITIIDSISGYINGGQDE